MNNSKKKSLKFWIIFWLVSIVLLFFWYVGINFYHKNYHNLMAVVKPVVKVLPIQENKKQEVLSIMDITGALMGSKKEQVFLLLFQNKDELRPGGGRIDSFGILKIKAGKVVFVDAYDTNIFDSRLSTQIEPPKPMQDYLGIKHFELRDSNWSPDFIVNAERAEYLYHLKGGREKLDGVIALSSKLLPSLLEEVGSIKIKGYPGVYNTKNVVGKLEYQVEKGYTEQDIEKGKRKYIIKKMTKIIVDKTQKLNWEQKKNLLKKIEQHLNEKDIMIYFNSPKLQEKIEALGWSGEVDQNVQGDFLMMVDANLGARKSDAVVKRKFRYTVNFRHKKPVATLKIVYNHQGKVRDLLIDDYLTYLRVYVPEGSWLFESNGFDDMGLIDFKKELGKKVFGTVVKVLLGKTKTVEFKYNLPSVITFDNYQLLIQKQSGIDKLQGEVVVIDKTGIRKTYTVDSTKDVKIKVR